MNFREKFYHSNDITRKIFSHNFLEVDELESITLDGRRYYTTPSGKSYPSVTTCLSEISKPYINSWKERVGEEEAAKILRQAGHRGTAVHAIAEKYMRNDLDYLKGSMPFDAQNFTQIKNILDTSIDNILGIEYPLFSDRLRTAGRTDLVAEWLGKTAIIDFKTSRYPKEKKDILTYFMQLTCYAMMLKERINIDAKDIVIVMMVDHQEPIIFHEKTKNYLRETLKYFKNYNDPCNTKDPLDESLRQS